MDDRDFQYMQQPQQQGSVPADSGVIDPFAPEHPINSEPFVRYCRNCGAKVEPGASVCVHCNYVLDVESLQRAQRLVRVRHQQAIRQAQRNRGLLGVVSDVLSRVLVGDNGARPNTAYPVQQAPRQRYMYHTEGTCYCSGCGAEVEEGAVVCVHCGYVINPAAVAHAQMVVSDRNAKLTANDVIRSLLIPGHGRKTYEMYHARRPEIAKTCRTLGRINKFFLIAGTALLLWLISNL